MKIYSPPTIKDILILCKSKLGLPSNTDITSSTNVSIVDIISFSSISSVMIRFILKLIVLASFTGRGESD
jgi:hypothetical protein